MYNCHLNDNRGGAERTVTSKLFHVRCPVTGNKRLLTVTNRGCSTSTMSVSADDLSWRLESKSATQCSNDDGDNFKVATVKSTQRGINEALLNAEMTLAMNLLKENLPKRYIQVVLKLLLPLLAFSSLIWNCIHILLSIPVTSASCERSFSAMKRTNETKQKTIVSLALQCCSCTSSVHYL